MSFPGIAKIRPILKHDKRSTAKLQKLETKYDKNYYHRTMKVFEKRKNISRLACKYLPLINDVVERSNPDLERMLDLHKKIFDLNEENGSKLFNIKIKLKLLGDIKIPRCDSHLKKKLRRSS